MRGADEIDQVISDWRQGDVSCDAGLAFLHLADLSRPHSPASLAAAKGWSEGAGVDKIVCVSEDVPGIVMLTQTCDIVRPCRDRPFVEIALLVAVDAGAVEQVRRRKRPAYAYVPAMAGSGLVADLDRIMTVEKAVVANWKRIPGWKADAEGREFGRAIAWKRSRFAFPDDFVRATSRFRARLFDKHGRDSAEGECLRALREIRVQAKPSWDHAQVSLTIWFIDDAAPGRHSSEFHHWVEQWVKFIDQAGRFRVESALVCRLDDISARDYVESERLDFDSLSID